MDPIDSITVVINGIGIDCAFLCVRDRTTYGFSYLSIPFGWGGSPAHIAVLGDAISQIRASYGLVNTSWNFGDDFLSWLYAGDGIFVEICHLQRLSMCTFAWGMVTRKLLGPNATITQKLEEGGNRRTKHIIFGFQVNTDMMSIQLPEAKRAGATVLIHEALDYLDSHMTSLTLIQKVCGFVEHFKSASVVWTPLCAPVDALMRYHDGIGQWISCPNQNIWSDICSAMRVIQE